jgi:RHS repeat-associated protein
MARDIFKRWFRKALSSGPRRARKAGLHLERLEDRLAPATVVWTGGAGGAGTNWFDPANWAGGQLPGSADDAQVGPAFAGRTIAIAGGSATVHSLSCAANVVLGGAFFGGNTLNVAAASTIQGTLTLVPSANPTGAGSLTVNGVLTWTDGTMSGTGATTAAGGLVLGGPDGSPHFPTLDGRTLNNAGPVSVAGLTATSGWFEQRHGSTFNNLAGGAFDLDHAFRWRALTPDCTVNNAGTITWSGSGTFLFEAFSGFNSGAEVFNNSGTVQVRSGTLEVGGGTDSGSFHVAAGATLAFSGLANDASKTRTTLTATSSISGAGTVQFGGTPASQFTVATVVDAGKYTVTGPTLVKGDAVSFTGGTPLTMPSLTLSDGSLSVSGDLDVTGPLAWTGGTMAGVGTTTAHGGLTVAFAPAFDGLLLDGRALANAATATATGTSTLQVNHLGRIINLPGATWRMKDGFDIRSLTLHENCDNQGAITADAAGSSENGFDIGFVNTGSVAVNSGTLAFAMDNPFRVDGTSRLTVQPTATLRIGNGIRFIQADVLGNVTNPAQFSSAGTVLFDQDGGDHFALLEVMSRDLGNVEAGFSHNFAYHDLTLNNAAIRLVDRSNNSGSGKPGALYVDHLTLDYQSTLDLNGLHVYARSLSVGSAFIDGHTYTGDIRNGVVRVLVPGGNVAVNTPVGATVDAAHPAHDWTFFGRAGQSVVAHVETGALGLPPAPPAPTLDYAQVQLVDGSGHVLATGSNTAAGADINLSVNLPADGVYHVKVQAPPAHPGITGNYELAVFDATVTTQPLILNQESLGSLATPFDVDQWTFLAAAGQQVQFNLAGTSAPGIVFKLSGPNGWTGFTNQTSSSAPLTLPATGAYTLIASTTGASSGSYTFTMTGLSQTPLTLGVPYSGTLLGTGQSQLFTVKLTQSNPLLIHFQDATAGDGTEVYARLGAPPSRVQYDVTDGGHGAGHVIAVPFTSPGTWYILVYTPSVPAPSHFTLEADSAAFQLTGVSPAQAFPGQTATLTIAGAGFVPGTRVALVAGGTGHGQGTGGTYPARSVSADAFNRLSAVFDLTTVPAGTYDVRVTLPDGTSSTLPGAFTVRSGGQGKFETHLSLAGSLGSNSPATLYLQYANTGTAPLPAPVLTVEAQDPNNLPLLTLDPSLLARGVWTSAQPAGFSSHLQVYASGATPGWLEPGESVTAPIYCAGLRQLTPRTVSAIGFDVRELDATDTTPIDWGSWKPILQPSWLSADAWSAMFTNLTAQVSPTWGDYVRTLSRNAAYLNQLGSQVTDVSRLFAFAVEQAGALLAPVASLATATDASFPTPGLSLDLTRSYSSTIACRYSVGPFGRGWYTPWQESLQLGADGTVTLRQTPDRLRIFQPDRRTSGAYFGLPGDTGTLVKQGDGSFRLTGANGQVTHFTAAGRLDSVQDANGNRITAGYTGGLLTSLTDSSGAALTLTCNAAGLVRSVTDPAGRTTTYGYDPTNTVLLSVTSPAGTTAYTYHPGDGGPQAFALLSATDPSGVTQHFQYDAYGRLAATSVGSGLQPVGYSYDAPGEITTTDADGVTTRAFFDDLGQLTRTEDGLGNYVVVQHNGALLPVRTTDTLGHSSSQTWAAGAQLQSSTDANGQTAVYAPGGPNHQPSAYTDPDGNTIQYGYNPAGDLTSATYPDGTTERAVYDALGDPTALVNRRGQVIQLTYNAAGQVTHEAFPDGSAYGYTYDGRGRLKTATDGQGTTTFSYNTADQLTEVDYPDGHWLKYASDGAGRRTQMRDDSGLVVNYGYDTAGRLTSLKDGTGAALVTYTYDAAGRLQREDKGNGTYTVYSYDGAGRAQSIVNRAPGGAVNSRFDYTYDAAGNPVTLTTLDGRWTYSYDPTGQLIHAVFASTNPSIPNQDLTYQYDANGNRTATVVNGTTTAYSSNSLNQYTVAGATTYQFDLDGNLTRATGPGGTTNYTYDSLNRLVQVAGPAGTWQYRYDALGHRTAVTVNGQQTDYLVDPTGLGDVVAAFDGSPTPTASYAYGLGLVATAGTGGWSYYDFDALGSTAGLSGAAGSYVNRYAYDPFGDSLLSSATVANPFGFVGVLGVMSDGNGLNFMRARLYNPGLGRFLSQDPLRLGAGDTNFYRYAANRPTIETDPSGTTGARAHRDALLRQAEKLEGEAKQLREGDHGGLYLGDIAHDLQEEADRLRGRALETSTYLLLNPQDPNDVLGPAGYGPQNFIAAGQPLAYRIDFENAGPGTVPTPPQPATAPAQQADVTDELPGALDWGTFQFTEVGFGDTVIAVPPGRQFYATAVPMTDNGVTFGVNIELSFDTATGHVRATFRSVDPATQLPPDVLTGFLPPEDGTGRGKGHVSYAVQPRAGLPTGTQIRNVALITFDRQAAIATDQANDYDPTQGTDPSKEALATLDAAPPTSSVAPLPATSAAAFTVTWSGQDDAGGSGVAAYDVFVSDNGGPFVPFQTATAATSAPFTGQPAHAYAFYSVATDNVGNRQPTPTRAQASTTVANSVTVTLFATLAPAKVGAAYGQALTAGGGTGPYHFSITAGSLPPGLALNATTGVLSGMPTRPGTFQFTVRAADSSPAPGPFGTSQGFTLTVAPGDAAALVFLTQPGRGPANGWLAPLQVLVLDRYGNPLSGVVVRLALVAAASHGPSGFAPGSVVQATAVNGVATFSRVAISARGSYRLLAEVGPVEALSEPFSVAPRGRRS